MICKECQNRKHDKCKGGSWCDCAHVVTITPDSVRHVQKEPVRNDIDYSIVDPDEVDPEVMEAAYGPREENGQ